MQEPKRFEYKIIELVDSIERHIADVKVDKQLEEQPPDVFISYCWKNSRDAIKKGTKTSVSSLGNKRFIFIFKSISFNIYSLTLNN